MARIVRTEETGATIRTMIRTVGAVVAVAAIAWAITQFAGQSTDVAVNAGFSLIADVRVGLAYGAALGCLVWALAERKSKRRSIARLTERTTRLERDIDPGRTSSHLTAHGTTNPEDMRR